MVATRDDHYHGQRARVYLEAQPDPASCKLPAAPRNYQLTWAGFSRETELSLDSRRKIVASGERLMQTVSAVAAELGARSLTLSLETKLARKDIAWLAKRDQLSLQAIQPKAGHWRPNPAYQKVIANIPQTTITRVCSLYPLPSFRRRCELMRLKGALRHSGLVIPLLLSAAAG